MANAEPSKEQRTLNITKETPSHKKQEKPINIQRIFVINILINAKLLTKAVKITNEQTGMKYEICSRYIYTEMRVTPDQGHNEASFSTKNIH